MGRIEPVDGPAGNGPATYFQYPRAAGTVAVITPMAVQGDWGARLALVATLGVMLTTQKALAAIAAGIVTAALWRLWL